MDLDSLRTVIFGSIMEGDRQGAERMCDVMAEHKGGEGDADYLRALVRQQEGQLDEAITLFASAASQLPGRADIAYNYGNALQLAGHLDQAVMEWSRAVCLAPDHADAFFNLARAATDCGRLREAAEFYTVVLELRPGHCDALFNLGNVLYRSGDFNGAAKAYSELLKRKRTFAEGWVNYGLTLRAMGMEIEAELFYRRAIENDAGSVSAHWNLGVLLLSRGHWREGLMEFEWRLGLPDAPKPNFPWPRLTGDEPAGTRVLLWNDQGRGDAIQYLRFAGRLAERGYRVAAFVQDDLKTLAAVVPGVERAIGFSEPPTEIDVHVPLLSLPLILDIDPAALWQGPWVGVEDTSILPPNPEKIRIGVVWAGNPTHANDANRSIRLADLAPLFTLSSVEWVSLQVGGPAEQLAGSEWAGTVLDLSSQLTDFTRTAAVIGALDLVISVDTAVAHLAGAMERPVWVLVPAIGTDWRWGKVDVATPWYPSMRLFRQRGPGDWASVIGEVKSTLEMVLPV